MARTLAASWAWAGRLKRRWVCWGGSLRGGEEQAEACGGGAGLSLGNIYLEGRFVERDVAGAQISGASNEWLRGGVDSACAA